MLGSKAFVVHGGMLETTVKLEDRSFGHSRSEQGVQRAITAALHDTTGSRNAQGSARCPGKLR